jgi:hypothetical protein
MYDQEIAECYRRIRLGASLNTLLNNNPDFRSLIVEGFLRDQVLQHSLNINSDESGTVAFLRGVSVFQKYLDRVRLEAEQAQIDLQNYQQLIQQDGQ